MAEKTDRVKELEALVAAQRAQAAAMGRDQNHELELKKVELGLLGRIFGSHQNAPFYTAAVIAIISLIALIAFLALNNTEGAKLVSTVLLASLAFAFGRGTEG